MAGNATTSKNPAAPHGATEPSTSMQGRTARVPPGPVIEVVEDDSGTEAAPLKRKRGGRKASKAKGKVKVEGAGEEPAGPVQTIEMENDELWQRMTEALESACDELRVGDADQARKSNEIAKWRIGCATLRFAGIGTVEGVVNLSDDPNERDNPRELLGSHVSVLADVFKAGNKRDLQSPIRIMLPRELISDALAAQMREVNIHDPSTKIPRLVLERETAEREDRLERELWLQSDGKVLLGTDDLTQRMLELRQLREDRPRATLLNGNHRIAAMRAACVPLYQEQRDILRRQRAGEPTDELTERVNRMTEQLRHASYVVEVFDNKAPPHVVAWLSQNEEDRPNLAPRSGEKLWQLTRHQEGWASRMVERGEAVDRTDALNKLYSVKDMGGRLDKLDERELEWAATIDVRPRSAKEQKKDGELSSSACRELMGHPVLNDMVLDVWAASLLFNVRMHKSHVQAMKKDGGGAAFAVHFWLSARVFIKIFNVAGGEKGLAAAEGFLERAKHVGITAEGHEGAVEHWEALHANEQKCPVPLQQVAEADLSAYETILKDELKRVSVDGARNDVETTTLGYDYESDEFVLAVRNVYTRWAAKIAAKNTPHARLAAASLRLYAVLPRWRVGCKDNRFFPAAVLPTRSRYASIEKHVAGAQDSAGLCMLELLMERWSLPWTYGAIGVSTSRNSGRWSDRMRGPHRIVRYCMEATELGCRSARLSRALGILENHDLIAAYEAAEEFDKDLADLRQRCGASRSGPANPPILATLTERHEERYGTVSVVQSKLSSARTALRQAIWEGKGDVPGVLAAHPILTQTVSRQAWDAFDFKTWALGWRDEPGKRANTVQGGLGWLMLEEELRVELGRRIFDEAPAARELLRTARAVSALRAQRPWWEVSKEGFNEDEEVEEEEDQLPEEEPEGVEGGEGEGEGSSSPALEEQRAEPRSDRGPDTAASGQQRKESRSSAPRSRGVPTPAQAPAPAAASAPRRDAAPAPAPPPKKDKGKGKQKEPEPEPEPEQEEQERELAVAQGSSTHDTTSRNARKDAFKIPRGAELLSEMLHNLNPGHVALSQTFSCKLPNHVFLYDHFGSKDSPSDPKLIEDGRKRLHKSLGETKRALELVNEERACFRAAAIELGRTFTTTSSVYLAEMAIGGLARNALLMKDMFVTRVARAIQTAYELQRPALVDALHMAAQDELYEEELYHINRDGVLSVNLGLTLAKAARKLVPAAETDVKIGTIPSPPGSRGRSTVWKDASSFFPMHGYGRDEQETQARGIWGLSVVRKMDRASDEPAFTGVRQAHDKIRDGPDERWGLKARLGYLLRGDPTPDDPTETVRVETDAVWVWQSTPSIFSTGNVASALQPHSAVGAIEFSDAHRTVAAMWEETAEQDVVDLRRLVLAVTQPTASESAPDQTGAVGGEPSQQGGAESPSLGGPTQPLRGDEGSTRPSGRRGSTPWEGMEVDRPEQGGSDATPPPGQSSVGSSDHEATQSSIVLPPLTQPGAKLRPAFSPPAQPAQKRKRDRSGTVGTAPTPAEASSPEQSRRSRRRGNPSAE
ncbi:hypothetical protein FRC06_011643 [Ceratobasidium sp. 370]|nr:hypothetical protein FRC06_011643 [Ceratobasidium sp. 370]